MPRIRCHYTDCILIDDGYCGAAAIEIDPELGCMTYKRSDDVDEAAEWEDEEEELDEWEDLEGEEEEDEDIWLDEDDY